MNKYKPEKLDFSLPLEELSAAMRRNREQLEKLDREAADRGEYVGRYVEVPHADSSAVYIITKENLKSVRVEVCTELGDDWVSPVIGEKGSLAKSYVDSQFGFRSYIHKLKEEGELVINLNVYHKLDSVDTREEIQRKLNELLEDSEFCYELLSVKKN